MPSSVRVPTVGFRVCLWASVVLASGPTMVAMADPDTSEEGATEPLPDGVLEYRTAGRYQPIYRTPDGRGALRGTLVPGESFTVVEHVAGPRCAGGLWGGLPAGGYTCLGTTDISDVTPVLQPRLAAFDQPRPEEYSSYLETGTYDRDDVDQAEPILPFISFHRPAPKNLR